MGLIDIEGQCAHCQRYVTERTGWMALQGEVYCFQEECVRELGRKLRRLRKRMARALHPLVRRDA